MDRVHTSKDEKQTIYEIYRACRLCGAGAGYKMPIIQSVFDLEGNGIELSQKIKECLQIEVTDTDRMPPLICELCVDKVDDFYEFMNLCHKTNKQTRLSLGLPMQNKSRDSKILQEVPSREDSKKLLKSEKNKVLIKKIIKKKSEEKVRNYRSLDNNLKRVTFNMSNKENIKKKNLENEISVSCKVKKFKGFTKRDLKETRLTKLQKKALSSFNKSENENGPSHSRGSSPQRRGAGGRKKKDDSHSSDTLMALETPVLVEKSKKRTREQETRIDTPIPAKKVKLPDKAKDTPKPRSKARRLNELEQLLMASAPAPAPAGGAPAAARDRAAGRAEPKRTAAKTEPKEPKKITETPIKAKVPEPPKPKPAQKAPESKKVSEPKTKKVSESKTKKVSEPKTNKVSNKTKTETPKKTPAKTPKPAEPKVYELVTCSLCHVQLKSSQGLASHNISKHVPTFTSPKMACNACELWFPSPEEASAHHHQHRTQDQPYKCLRCYGYFKLLQEYTDHFGSGLCLAVFEVPDVQCWRCGRAFATNNLMDTHKCAGEDGRPGGNCAKCNRSYALLKNQLKHELTCTYRRKGEVSIEPDVSARLRPARVLLARCDKLCDTLPVNVAHISHRYGLDSKAMYPYLPSEVKKEPSTKHMVSINDSVKDEFWEHSNDSQTVDTLSNISLKSINKMENLENDDLTKKIFSIIDNLEDDVQTSDSDSVLNKFAKNDKCDDQSAVVGVSDLSEKQSQDDCVVESVSDLEKNCENNYVLQSTGVFDDKIALDDKSDVTNVDSETNDTNINVNNDKVDDDSAEKTVDDNLDVSKMDVSETPNLPETSIETNQQSDKNNDDDDKNEEIEAKDDSNEKPSKNNISTQIDTTLHNNEDIEHDRIDTSNIDPALDTENISFVSENIRQNDTVDSANKSMQDCDVNINSDKRAVEENNINSDKLAVEENNINSDKLAVEENNINSDKLAVEENNIDENKCKIDHEVVENYESPQKTPPTDEEFSKIDEITNKILKESEFAESNAVEVSNSTDKVFTEPHSDSISLNSLKSNDVELLDKFNVDDLSDDGKQLMADLDAQIGEFEEEKTEVPQGITKQTENNNISSNNDVESTDNHIESTDNHVNDRQDDNDDVENNENNTEIDVKQNGVNDRRNNEKSKDYLIDNLLKKQDDLKSLELDNISDEEFNFET